MSAISKVFLAFSSAVFVFSFSTMAAVASVKVTFKGCLKDHIDFRDVVHATQAQMLKKFGDNVFQGRVIEVHIGTLPSDQAFTFTDWTAEMKSKASICISQDDTLIESLEIAIGRIQSMVDKGMDNGKKVLRGLIDKANSRIKEIKSGKKPPIKPDENDVEFIVGALPGEEGYLWVFPKSDHYNIGYCYNSGTPGMREALDELLAERWPGEFVRNGKWKLESTGEVVDCKKFGSVIPSYNDPKLFDEPVSGKNWVLCGDAAGHVNPIHGEGLNHCALGGRLAAKAISKGDPTLFEQYWRAHYSRDMYRAANTKHKIYKPFFMKVGFALGRTPALFGMLADLTRGEYKGKATTNFWFKLPLALIQALFGFKHKEIKALN